MLFTCRVLVQKLGKLKKNPHLKAYFRRLILHNELENSRIMLKKGVLNYRVF